MEFFSIWKESDSLPLFALLIVVAIFYWLLKNQERLNLHWKEALLIAVLHVVIGWSAMRLMAIAEAGGNLEKAANMRLYGAFFLLPVMYCLWAKRTGRSVALTMDVAAICVIFGAVSGRMNCLSSGCCEGIPMGFVSEIRWPLRQVELLYYAVFVWIYSRKILKKKTHGEVYSIFLLSYGTLRFLSEFVREEFTGQIGVFHLAHIWSLIAIAVGAVMYYKVRKNIRPGEVRRNDTKSKRLAKGGK